MKISNNPIMVRPTLIVGLGGTGILVCQWVEHYIRELLNCVPPFIRFLKLDADVLEEGGPPNASQSDFINLRHYMDVGAVVRDYVAYPEFHPHLDWFKDLNLDSCDVQHGLMGIPRLGRLVFVELRESIIHKAVAARFSDLRACTQKVMENDLGQYIVAPEGAPAVHVASSVCGGTGAGMLIDMAYHLQWWSQESFPRDAEIVGHLMLPEAFTVDPMLRSKLQTVAAATLEQLEFFSDSRRDDIPVRYRESYEGHVFERLRAPFDLLYLLNGQGDMGCGNRKHMVKIIARTIRAMMIEPTSQRVTSDANNKVADILSSKDQANGRRQRFASYGFWYGTPGHRRKDVESWICSRLEEMGTGPSPNYTDYSDEVQEKLRVLPDISTKANKIGKPTKSVNWQLPQRITPQTVTESVLRCLKKYLSDTVEPVVRSASEEIFPPNEPYKPFLDAANVMIEQDVFKAAPLKPLSQVGVCLNQWIDQLDGWPENERPEHASDYIEAKEKIMEGARESLRDLASNIPPDTWTPNDINPPLSEVIDRNWSDLVKACLYENLSKSIEQTSEVFRLRKQVMDCIVSLASRGCLSDSEEVLSVDDRKNHNKQEEDFFSTPLYASSDPTNNPRASLTKDFRQNLVRPILRHTVLTLDKASDSAGDMDNVKKKLERVVRNLNDKMNQFLDEAEKENQRVFHRGVLSDTEAASHRYYKPVCDVNRLAAPKIDLDHANVYAKPLDLSVSQHVSKCCVPDLLSYNLGSTFREAYITESYEKETKVWFQLLRLRYGFCLEAISTYRSYVEATEDYLNRKGFKYSDVWLDRRWYMAYQKALADWKQEKDAFQVGNKRNKAKYDKIAALIGNIRKSIQVVFEGLHEGILKYVSEVDKAVEAAIMCKEIKVEVNNIWDNLDPSDQLRIIKKGLKKCEGPMMEVLSAKSNIILDQFPKEEQTKIRVVWNRCQQYMKELVDTIDRQ